MIKERNRRVTSFAEENNVEEKMITFNWLHYLSVGSSLGVPLDTSF